MIIGSQNNGKTRDCIVPITMSFLNPLFSKQLRTFSCFINQSVKIYIAPIQDTYSEALPTQAKRKLTVWRRWWNWEQAPFGRCLRSTGSPFQVVEPTTENERVCIVAERANGTTKLPRAVGIHSFGHFYSAPSSPLLLRGAPDYSTDTVSEFHAEAHR